MIIRDQKVQGLLQISVSQRTVAKGQELHTGEIQQTVEEGRPKERAATIQGEEGEMSKGKRRA